MSPKFNDSITVQKQRKALEGFAKLSILPGKTKIQPIQIDKLAGEFISVGDTPDDCVVLYLHGGAYNIGSPNTHRDFAARISKASKIKTLLVDYRLAPENPYPAAGLACVLVPTQLLANYGVILTPMGIVIYQFWGTALIGIGLLSWFVRGINELALQRKLAIVFLL
jgi:hypothetical protein